MKEDANPIVVGQVSGVYGINGWLKVNSYTRPPENLFLYPTWSLSKAGVWHEFRLVQYRKHGKGYIVQLEGIADRDTAGQYLTTEIVIYRSQLPPLPAGEYYWQDLLNKQVVNLEGKSLGFITEIWETGANDVLVIDGEERYLIPFVRDVYIKEVDLAGNIVRVDWQRGDTG